MSENKLIIAGAGSGKTTFLVNNACEIEDENVLITTYTEANAEEIRKKFVHKKGYVPRNVTIQTWFSFLLQHGVRPYQSMLREELHDEKIGFFLTEMPSGFRFKSKSGHPIYWGEKDFFRFYFTKDFKVYSDKTAYFILKTNDITKGEVISRISRIYQNIFIDEIQDLAGYELGILSLFFKTDSKILLVGDPRQVTYLTHHSRKHKKYKNGQIESFINEKCKKDNCEIDTVTLKNTHRNNQQICDFAYMLFPIYEKCEPCKCDDCRKYVNTHEGVFIVKSADVGSYIKNYNPTILKWSGSEYPDWNFGKSKGLTFDRVLIYPTKTVITWLKDQDTDISNETRCKFYVAVTRARYSVAIVCDVDLDINGVGIYEHGV